MDRIASRFRAAWLYAVMLVFTQQGQANTGMMDGTKAAFQRATTFARDVGWQLEATATTTPPGPEPRPYAWAIEDGAITIYVHGRTGDVCGAHKERLFAGTEDNQPHFEASVAEGLARKYLALAGLDMSNSRLYRCEFNSNLDSWHVMFQRTYRGIPFRRDLTVVDMDPADGSLLGFGYNFLSPLPASMSDRMRRDGAVRRSTDYASRRLNYPGSPRNAQLEIVQPNYLWEYREAGAPMPAPTCSRVAWVVQLDAPYQVTEFWVDAETGEVIGGDHSLGRVKSRTPALSLDGTSLAKIKVATKCKLVDAKEKAYGAITRAVENLTHRKQPVAKLPVTLAFHGKERTYTFGYSPNDHCLALVQKTYKGKVIKGNRAWETTKEFEDLIAKYLPH